MFDEKLDKAAAYTQHFGIGSMYLAIAFHDRCTLLGQHLDVALKLKTLKGGHVSLTLKLSGFSISNWPKYSTCTCGGYHPLVLQLVPVVILLPTTGTPDAVSHSCLLAASTKESGAWLDALPVSSLGLRMDNNTIRLCLGAPLYRTHTCHHCGVQVDGTATHGLRCKWSKGYHQRHAAVNDIIHCMMSAAHLLSRLEPTGLSRSNGKCPDGKHPNGVMLVTW